MSNARLLRLLYSTLITIALPVALLRLVWKSRKNPDYRQRISERLACQLPIQQHSIWIHAVSVGEFLAVLPLIKQLQAHNQPLLITTTTPTGSAMVKEKLGESVSHCYLPFDTPTLVKRFVQQAKPLLAVFIETEIWPNYLHQLSKTSTPTLLINARLSEKSFKGYQRFGSFAHETLSGITAVACQNVDSQQRFLKLGANASVLGNIKFDLSVPSDLTEKTTAIQALLNHQPFILAASTHKGEDSIILNAFQNSDYASSHRLVIAPRHPERSQDIQQICKTQSISAQQYTTLQSPMDATTHVLIIDTLGELLYFYALADIAIIGGAFVERGGHNPLEAALFSTPCIIGPHYFNFQTLIDSMKQNNAIIISDEKSLLDKNQPLDNVGTNAHNFLQENQGALSRYTNLILSHTPAVTRDK